MYQLAAYLDAPPKAKKLYVGTYERGHYPRKNFVRRSSIIKMYRGSGKQAQPTYNVFFVCSSSYYANRNYIAETDLLESVPSI